MKNLTAAATVENSTLWQRTPFSTLMAEAQLSACMVQSQILNTMVGPQLLNSMVGPQLLNSMVGPQLLNLMVRPQLHNTIVRPQLNLFQNLPNSQPISSGHEVIHTPARISCLGFIMTMVIVISFACERKLHQLTTHLNS